MSIETYLQLLQLYNFCLLVVELKGCNSTPKSNSLKSNKLSGKRLPGGIPVEYGEDSRENCW